MIFDIKKKSEITNSFRVQTIKGKFDLDVESIVENFKGEVDIEGKEWSIGVIFGNSGTGKTSIAKELFQDAYIFQQDYKALSVIDDMPEDKTIDEITRAFNSVGFSSPPSWLKPYAVLSNGEKMRVDLAKSILDVKDLVVFDEFTSVVDRQVAKITSMAISKAVRKTNKKFIAVSCHDDILEWLEPDWVFDTNSMSFFLTKNISAQKLKSKLEGAQESFGETLGSITI